MQNITIREVAPHIFQRPLLYVGPSDSMLQVATFLATGPQIYVDGLVVLEGRKRLMGRIGGYALASHILTTREKWLEGRASDLVEPLEHPLQEDDPIENALRIFMETRFAFMPVASKGEIVASLSIRDLLGVARGIRTQVNELASPLLTIDNDASVLDALRFMVDKGVRNLVFATRDDGSHYVINDRKVLAYLLCPQTKELVSRKSFEVLAHIKLSSLGAVRGKQVDEKSTVGSAAHLFSDIGITCLFSGNRILTPWDIVMKGSGFID
jgi:CBS domain-containing protein